MPTKQKKLLEIAKINKNDEFYTQLTDIEKELSYYRPYFKNKIVYCNCDDPYESNFFKYFALNFNFLKLKKLITTCYISSPIANTEIKLTKKLPYKIVINDVKDLNSDGTIDLEDIKKLLLNKKNSETILHGNGDFRSPECIKLLKECDIVVTNPPFSLFREFIATLDKYGKKFLIIGNVNAVSYKEVFKLIMRNKLWMGVSIHSGDREFRVPNEWNITSKSKRIDSEGNQYVKVVGVRWFTNLDHKQRHDELIMWKKYDKHYYLKYDNFDAINVDHVREIPKDYFKKIGVPVNFLDKYNPKQFRILGSMSTTKKEGFNFGYPYINGKKKYARIIIERRNNENSTEKN